MAKKGKIFRSQSSQMPGTDAPFSASPIRRRMSTAIGKISDAPANRQTINVSGYTTVKANVFVGKTQSAGADTQNAAGFDVTPSRLGFFRKMAYKGSSASTGSVALASPVGGGR
jgi:hypothetical protein